VECGHLCSVQLVTRCRCFVGTQVKQQGTLLYTDWRTPPVSRACRRLARKTKLADAGLFLPTQPAARGRLSDFTQSRANDCAPILNLQCGGTRYGVVSRVWLESSSPLGLRPSNPIFAVYSLRENVLTQKQQHRDTSQEVRVCRICGRTFLAGQNTRRSTCSPDCETEQIERNQRSRQRG
jgi:hypothetical protein